MSLDLDLNYFENNFKVDKSSNNRVYQFEEFILDAAHLMLSRGGEEIPLVPKAVETLLVLVEQRGNILSKDELMDAIWTDSIVAESNLAQYLHILRKTLGKQQNGQPFIETLRRRGYRFNGNVEVVENINGDLARNSGADIDKPQPEESEAPFVNPTPQSKRALRVERHGNVLALAEWKETGSEMQPAAARGIVRLASGSDSKLPNKRLHAATLIVISILVFGAAILFGVYRFTGGGLSNERAAAAMPFSQINLSRLTTSGKTKRASISPDGNYVAHVTEDAYGHSLWVRHVAAPTDLRIAGPAATEYVGVTFAPDGDSVYYVALDRDKGESQLFRVPVLGGPSSMAAYDTGAVSFSPDGSRMAYFRTLKEGSSINVANADGTNERMLALRRLPDYFQIIWNAPSWSPDGKTIACPIRVNDERGQYDTLIGVDVGDGVERPLTQMRWQNIGQPKWLRDGLVVTASEGAADPQQIWHISEQDGTATRVTHDLNYYYDLSITSDESRMAAVQIHALSNLWVVRNGEEGQAKQIASEIGWVEDIAWTPDGRIVYKSSAGDGTELWVINADGSGARQLTADARAGRGLTVTPDGRYIVFASDRAGRSNIWRMDVDGTNFKQVTDGEDDFYPEVTPDGARVVFQRGFQEPRLWTVPIDGGEPVQIADTRASRPAVSPDGNLVAYHYLDSEIEKSRWSIGIVSYAGGKRLNRFDFPPTVSKRFVRFSPDGRSIVYANDTDAMSDLWLQPLDGGSPRQLTDFRSDQILTFNWSQDGQTLAIVRNIETSNVVLISHGVK